MKKVYSLLLFAALFSVSEVSAQETPDVQKSKFKFKSSSKKQKSTQTEAGAILEQKKATEVKEVVSSEQLSKQGVSDASGAVSKVAGVVKSEGSGDVFVRGLGDRYLSTSLNGLPIPSNSVSKKNIDLSVLPSGVINSVSISKTYTPSFYADFGSSNVDVSSKEHSGKDYVKLGIKGGINTNAISHNMKETSNYNQFGFYNNSDSNSSKFNSVSWNTRAAKTPYDLGLSLVTGQTVNLFGKKSKLYFDLSHSVDFSYREGEFNYYRANRLRRRYTDFAEYKSTASTEGLLSLLFPINKKNKLKFTSLMLNEGQDIVSEGGLNGEGYVFDNQPIETRNYLLDQRNKQNLIFVEQLEGQHKFKSGVKLDWALGYNNVKATEPNTSSNELVLTEQLDGNFQFTNNTNFQTSRNYQELSDNEFNGRIKTEFNLAEISDGDLKLALGGNFRIKKRDFESQFIGISGLNGQVSSFNEITNFLQNGLSSGTLNELNNLSDSYSANQDVYAGFAQLQLKKKLYDISLGARYEVNNQDLDWNVGNYVSPEGIPRVGNTKNEYNDIYPSFNFALRPSKRSQFRLGYSQTISIPQLRELSPFEYTDATRRLFRGNPDLVFPEITNFDLKFEFFPRKAQLLSLATFYKKIDNPINVVQNVSSAGFFRPENTGNKAEVFGVELETKINLVENKRSELKLSLNGTYMNTNQDLFSRYQFNNNTENDLQGASDFITNASLSYKLKGERPFKATLTNSYSSDKIFALGAPNQGTNTTEIFSYNDNIIQKGFFTLDLVLEKELNDRMKLNMKARNILNPRIELEQGNNVTNLIAQPVQQNEVGTATLESYRKGVDISAGFEYKF